MTKDWEGHRELILSLYKEQNRPLNEVMGLMETRYNFKASVRAYRSRLKRWAVTKYNVGRRSSILTDKSSSSSKDSAFGSRRTSRLSPARVHSRLSPGTRPVLESPTLVIPHDYYEPTNLFGPATSVNEESSPDGSKSEPGTPPSPYLLYNRATLPGAKASVTLPPIVFRRGSNEFGLPPFTGQQRPHHTGFIGQGSPEAAFYGWAPDLSAYGTHAT